MMKFGMFIAATLLLSQPFGAFAVTSEAEVREFLHTQLNVTLDASCSLIQNEGRDPDGPFQKLDRCVEKELAGVTTVTGKVYRVVDGDTIHFYVGTKLLGIRMLGIDTAELHFRSRGQPKWGIAGRDSLRSMVSPGDEITLQLDQQKCDRYGRILGHVFKGKTNLNFEQVRLGFAVNYCIAPNLMHCDAYALGYMKAKEENLNVHTDSCFVTPYVWRRAMNSTIMDKKVKNTLTNQVYSAKEYYLVPVEYRIFYP